RPSALTRERRSRGRLCSSLRADSGKGEEGEGQEVSIRPWADFTPERRQEVDITLWNK
ncbi:Uncharacterized protein DAT39_014080, partial [Clarias magur]